MTRSLAIAAAALSLAAAAAAAPLIDQSTSQRPGYGIEVSAPVDQTFTVGRPGYLVRLDLLLARLESTTARLTLDLRNPTGLLASWTVDPAPGDAIFGQWGWQTFELLDDAVAVQPGDVLTLVLTATGGTRNATCEEWCWGARDDAAYDRGAYSTNPWIDMTFTTWVDDVPPAHVPEPGTLALLAVTALAAAAARRSGRFNAPTVP